LRDVIPEPIFEAIQEHLRTVGDNAQTAWPAANAEEDTLTGDFCGRLAINPQRVRVNGGKRWEWSIRYKKFRGRGKGAFEKRSGADGIIDIEVTTNGEKLYKGLLFQAKKDGLRGDAKLTEQVRNMESLAKGGSAIFDYGRDGYRAIPGGIFLKSRSDRQSFIERNEHPLGSFLGDEFLSCSSGLRGMYFDAVRELLLVPGRGAIRVELHNRVRIDVGRLG
jgi:hypothetical protein